MAETPETDKEDFDRYDFGREYDCVRRRKLVYPRSVASGGNLDALPAPELAQ